MDVGFIKLASVGKCHNRRGATLICKFLISYLADTISGTKRNWGFGGRQAENDRPQRI